MPCYCVVDARNAGYLGDYCCFPEGEDGGEEGEAVLECYGYVELSGWLKSAMVTERRRRDLRANMMIWMRSWRT